MNLAYKEINGWFDFEALYDYALQRYPTGHFVEVGVYLGKSICYLAAKAQDMGITPTIDAIDIWEYEAMRGHLVNIYGDEIISPYKEFTKNCVACGVDGRINAIQKKSVEAARFYKDNSLDFVFIDASHNYDNVRQDIESYMGKVKCGGLIAGHDFDPNKGDVYRAILDSLPVNSKVKYWPPRTWSYEKSNE